MTTKRKYPVGIQSFESIRMDGYMYVDKTPLIYKMMTEGKPYFLSRPRRFGKSLLISTLEAVFSGRRELFEAFTTENGVEQPQLFIATTDWKWEKYPVFRFDFSAGDIQTVDQLDTLIDNILALYERQMGITPEVSDTNIRMIQLLRTAHQQTGKRAVVLVDEYDNFILHSIGDKEKTAAALHRFQNLFGPLKEMDDHIQFVFITGISKFSQMGIFSKLNHLANISMVPQYETLCGISEEELTTQLRQDIAMLGEAKGKTFELQLAELKQRYDGYHFSERMTDMYNPFSLVNAFNFQKIDNYWFDRGTSSALIDMLSLMPPVEIAQLEGIVCQADAFDYPFSNYDAPLPVLYQSGYLTITHYDEEYEEYTLGFPNAEVRRGFASCLYRYVTKTINDNGSKSALFASYNAFRRNNDLPSFIDAIRSFFAGVPYFLDNHNEHHYHALLYTLLVAFGADVSAEDSSAKGRADIVLRMSSVIYVMELKYDDTSEAALAQIRQKGYAEKYSLDGRPVIKVGLAFSSSERNITDWRVEE